MFSTGPTAAVFFFHLSYCLKSTHALWQHCDCICIHWSLAAYLSPVEPAEDDAAASERADPKLTLTGPAHTHPFHLSPHPVHVLLALHILPIPPHLRSTAPALIIHSSPRCVLRLFSLHLI